MHEDDDDMHNRNPGRRDWDGIHLLKWVPFLSLLFLMTMQTIYVTRYVSGLESSNTQLVSTVAEIRAEVKSLSVGVAQGAVPSAQMSLRMEYLEARLNELRGTASDNARRISVLENGRSRAR